MSQPFRYLVTLLLLAGLLPPDTALASSIRVAVASNFSDTAKVLAEKFESISGHRVVLIRGSTGKHYAQIKHGAPFDLFLAADADRPTLLEQEGKIVPGSRFTYAIGRLVLWSPQAGLVDEQGLVLHDGDFERIAIANPRLAPYGLAARELLRKLELWDKLQDRLVRGENIAQAFHFVASGNAPLGLVALAQLNSPQAPPAGSRWDIPPELYPPILQQSVQLTDNPATSAFTAFMQSPEAVAIIEAFGYATP